MTATVVDIIYLTQLPSSSLQVPRYRQPMAIRTHAAPPHPAYTSHATQSPPPIPAQILVGALMMGATVCCFSAKRAQTTEISEQKNDNAAKSRVYAAWRDLYHVSVHLFTTGANLVLSSSLLASP